jgi:hypothetical protein
MEFDVRFRIERQSAAIARLGNDDHMKKISACAATWKIEKICRAECVLQTTFIYLAPILRSAPCDHFSAMSIIPPLPGGRERIPGARRY